ncbi:MULTISPECIES: hypothetical protein [Cyanophyceae]|uniref:hypothetical protein n=1 Tax=Cyanophyceae TaxID=3028117 RepID=UPI00232E2518|nr:MULTISPECIES: hypothetical protein [Cyanophyceae]MDB9357338.1 hypothetical protein [Nodularia spumigena CS-587/03]MDB9532414.1 hypothetical protein [Nodularia spumigena CS-1038]MDB9305184.1 hypothetical protein [Nodularia spumigena CS-591/12]MDB9316796.1 hypothetical protein [Nodularia spumigena CS-590/01A]MDB9325095.1 hypothetical protein [Nodularia spumigena CS-590/02]
MTIFIISELLGFVPQPNLQAIALNVGCVSVSVTHRISIHNCKKSIFGDRMNIPSLVLRQ